MTNDIIKSFRRRFLKSLLKAVEKMEEESTMDRLNAFEDWDEINKEEDDPRKTICQAVFVDERTLDSWLNDIDSIERTQAFQFFECLVISFFCSTNKLGFTYMMIWGGNPREKLNMKQRTVVQECLHLINEGDIFEISESIIKQLQKHGLDKELPFSKKRKN